MAIAPRDDLVAVPHRRSEPRQADAIAAAELERALADPDPLHGIAQLVARWAAAFVLDPGGVTRTTALGADRMARRLGEALPDGDRPLRGAVWTLVRRMLSPRLAALNAGAFVEDDPAETTVDLAAHRGESTLHDLDLGDGEPAAAAPCSDVGRFALKAARSGRHPPLPSWTVQSVR